jgi:hypothetical protein
MQGQQGGAGEEKRRRDEGTGEGAKEVVGLLVLGQQELG